MKQVVALCNQKGGVAKTTTAISLGAALARMGKRVLLIDNDPQGSLTISLGQEPDALADTLSTVLGKIVQQVPFEPEEGILHHAEGVDFLPANIDLSGLEISLVNVMSRETVMRRYVDMLRSRYDHILIDCNPSLGMLTINALTAADSVLIPVEAQYLSARGMELLLRTVGMVQAQLNPSLMIEGVLLTKSQHGANHPKRIAEIIKEKYGAHIPVFETVIPLSVRAADASATGGSVLAYDPGGSVAAAYGAFADELVSGRC